MQRSFLPLLLTVALCVSILRAEESEKAQTGTALGAALGTQLKGLANDIDLGLVVKTAFEFADGSAKAMPFEDKLKIQPRMTEIKQNRLSGKADGEPLNADEKDKMARFAGEQLGGNLTIFKDEIDPEAFKAALSAAARGEAPALGKDQLNGVLQKAFARIIDRSKKEGEAFLAENKKKEGVTTTASGLQYKVLTEGKGPKPKAADSVTTHYKGTLVNGHQFDSSYDRGQPATFPVTGVIKGWIEALQLMPEGSKWQLYIPGDLAYPRGQPGIPPMSTLIFDIELLKVNTTATAPATTAPNK